MGFPLSSLQKVPYMVTHVDGTPLKAGNTIAVESSDVGSLSVAPDAAPLANSLASGFLSGEAKTTAVVRVTVSEKDAAGNVVDSTFFSVEVTAVPVTNLQVAIGAPVPK